MRLLRGAASASRALALTVTTTNCAMPRVGPYSGRLEISYDYLVEYNHNSIVPDADPLGPTLIGIGNAIAYGLAAVLDGCDVDRRPLYAVELASWHEVLESGYCEPRNPGSTCQVVRGITAIRSDSTDIDADVEQLAFDAIEGVFYEPNFLKQFVPTSFNRVDFGRIVTSGPAGDKKKPPAGGGSISKVPIIVTVMTLLALACVFMAGWIWRNRGRHLRTAKQPKAQGDKNATFLLGSAPPKYYELDEEPESGGSSSVANKVGEILAGGYENVSMTWSISDITSESGSILSNLSRTTSKLERIEEGDDEGSHEEWDGDDTDEPLNRTVDSIPPECLYCVDSSDLLRHHIDLFPVGMETDAVASLTEVNTSGLEGCRFVEDIFERHEEGIEVLSSNEDLQDPSLPLSTTILSDMEDKAALVSVEESTEQDKPVDESFARSDNSEHMGNSGYEHSIDSSSTSSLGADSSSQQESEHDLSAATSSTTSSDEDEEEQQDKLNATTDLSLLLVSTLSSSGMRSSHDSDGEAADDENSVSTCYSSDYTREASNESSSVLRGVEMPVLPKDKEETSC